MSGVYCKTIVVGLTTVFQNQDLEWQIVGSVKLVFRPRTTARSLLSLPPLNTLVPQYELHGGGGMNGTSDEKTPPCRERLPYSDSIMIRHINEVLGTPTGLCVICESPCYQCDIPSGMKSESPTECETLKGCPVSSSVSIAQVVEHWDGIMLELALAALFHLLWWYLSKLQVFWQHLSSTKKVLVH